jgi:ABC-type multidrug transport system fused ATPase/permease subunit
VSTVRGADQIVVLERGRVVERGTHDELLRLGGHYATLARHQQLEDELAAIG